MSATYSETFLKKYCRTNRIVCTRVSVSSERSLDFRTQIGQTLVVCEVKQIDMNENEREVLAAVNAVTPTSFYVTSRVSPRVRKGSHAPDPRPGQVRTHAG
jgi:hypothetical protein